MGNRMGMARVVVVSSNDAATIVDCLDGIAEQCRHIEVVVVDQESSDGTPDIAIRHPVPARVTVVRGGSLQRVVDSASRDVDRLLVLRADARPERGWIAAALAALDVVDLALGPDKHCGNIALDLVKLRSVNVFPRGDDVDEVLRRVRLAGASSQVVDGMRLVPACASASPPHGLPVTAPPPRDGPRHHGHVTVVLCTRDRLPLLGRCVQSLARLDDDDHDIVVIDNHPDPTVDPTDLPPRARLVHEPRPGLDIARNRGIEETDADIIAYIDDDCEADPHWITALRVAFADPDVGFVTGRVRAASLSKPTHRYFETQFSMDRGSIHRRFTPWDDRPWYPLWAAPLGCGCNMAFRRQELIDVGGFDELLDMGSSIGGGGDLDVYARLLDRGVTAEYTPDALVWHHHRDDDDALRKQFRGYGEAVGAYLMKAFLERRGLRLTAVRFFGARLTARLRIARDIREGSSLLPMRFLVAALVGQLTGPFLYLRARRRSRHVT